MINLLSPHDKRELRAARRNIILRRYTILVALTLLAIGAIFSGGIYIATTKRMAAERELESDRSQASEYQETRETAERFEANLNIARRILADEITYSTLITDIAQALPDNAILTDLTLNPEVLGTSSTLSAMTVNYEAALNLQERLEESPLFSDVSLISVSLGDDSTNPEGPAASNFPVQVQLSATINNPNAQGGE